MFIQYYNNTRSFIVNSFQHFVLYPSPAIKAIRPPPVRYLQNIAGLSYQSPCQRLMSRATGIKVIQTQPPRHHPQLEEPQKGQVLKYSSTSFTVAIMYLPGK